MHIKIDFISNWKLEYLFNTTVTTFLRDKANNLEWWNKLPWFRRGRCSEATFLSLLSYRYVYVSELLSSLSFPGNAGNAKDNYWLFKVRSWELIEFCGSPKYWFAIKNSVDSGPFLEAVALHLLIPVLQWIPHWSPVLVWILSHRRRDTVSQLKNKKGSVHFIIFNCFLLLCLVTRSIRSILCLYLLFSQIESFIRKYLPHKSPFGSHTSC